MHTSDWVHHVMHRRLHLFAHYWPVSSAVADESVAREGVVLSQFPRGDDLSSSDGWFLVRTGLNMCFRSICQNYLFMTDWTMW